ncbi:MAG: DUF3887 domain-containing protein [Cyanobacteriota bacterium]|nr:DUF3887 domain-containing protein [Cyanobacteriota bacterium]
MLRAAFFGTKAPTALAAGLTAALVAITAGAGAGLAPVGRAQAGGSLAQAGNARAAGVEQGLSVDQARAAANRIMAAEQRRDAPGRFAQFAPELQQATSPAMIAETMAKRPPIQSWSLQSVRGGLNSTTVEVTVKTSKGVEDLFIVLNSQAQITGYYVDRTDADASKVAAQFVRALSAGHYITARSFLAPSLQQEISPEGLQARWQGLQRETGNFIRVNRVIEAASNEEQHLVLVNTTFNRLTDNLFVLLDANNLIFNVDFPHELPKLRGSR